MIIPERTDRLHLYDFLPTVELSSSSGIGWENVLVKEVVTPPVSGLLEVPAIPDPSLYVLLQDEATVDCLQGGGDWCLRQAHRLSCALIPPNRRTWWRLDRSCHALHLHFDRAFVQDVLCRIGYEADELVEFDSLVAHPDAVMGETAEMLRRELASTSAGTAPYAASLTNLLVTHIATHYVHVSDPASGAPSP